MASPPKIKISQTLSSERAQKLTLERIQPATIEKCFRGLWLFAENQCWELELLCNAQLDAFHENSTDVPKARHIGVDENRKVEVLDDGHGVAILLAMTDDQSMRVLVNVFDTPALDAQVMVHQLDGTLVLLVERRLDHLKRSKRRENVSPSCFAKSFISRESQINWNQFIFSPVILSTSWILAELTLAGWDSSALCPIPRRLARRRPRDPRFLPNFPSPARLF